MRDIDWLLRANAGVVTIDQLRSAGLTTAGLTAIRRGWYRAPNPDPSVRRAVEAGGVLTCVSALRRAGVWVVEPAHDLHIRYQGRRRRPGRHCQPFKLNPPLTSAIDPLDIAIKAAANCLDFESLIVVFDSMLNKKMLELADVRTIVADSRFAGTALADQCEPRAQSGLETLVRLRLRSRRIKLEVQVPIPGVGWVDLLVGDRLVIETDGENFHQNFHADRDRDLKLKEMGYEVIRLSSEHVLDDWNTTVQRILVMIRRRDHRW